MNLLPGGGHRLPRNHPFPRMSCIGVTKPCPPLHHDKRQGRRVTTRHQWFTFPYFSNESEQNRLSLLFAHSASLPEQFRMTEEFISFGNRSRHRFSFSLSPSLSRLALAQMICIAPHHHQTSKFILALHGK